MKNAPFQRLHKLRNSARAVKVSFWVGGGEEDEGCRETESSGGEVEEQASSASRFVNSDAFLGTN